MMEQILDRLFWFVYKHEHDFGWRWYGFCNRWLNTILSLEEMLYGY